MNPINWHTEALDFCKRNNICPQDVTVGTIELAMQAGAALMVEDIHKRIIKPCDDHITKLRKDSLPHTNLVKTIIL